MQLGVKACQSSFAPLSPTLGPRKYPRGPQPQIGYAAEARARLLGGSTLGGLQFWVRPAQSCVASSSGIASAVDLGPSLSPVGDNALKDQLSAEKDNGVRLGRKVCLQA